MVDVHFESHVKVPVAEAFAYYNDYTNATRWLFGLASLEPTTEVVSGLGASFDAVFKVPPVKLHTTIEVMQWEQNSLVVFDSTKGFRNWSTWHFEPISETETKLRCQLGYELPGGLAGKALGRALTPIVALTTKHSDHNFRTQVEERWTAGNPGA